MGRVTFLGACGCVTGSSTLLEWGETRLLVDCGMYQGGGDLKQLNWAPFEFEPSSLTAVVVTHAHLDHTGLLPKLVREGFSGPIYCTRASRGLVSLILEDAGHIQEEQARYARKAGYSEHANPKPLYTSKDAKRAIRLLQTVPFDKAKELVPGVHVEWRRAGHLLGAGSVLITAKDNKSQRRTWCFSGDVGRWDVPILKDPEPPSEEISALLLESTYGDRTHHTENSRRILGEVIAETFHRGGMVIIPAFALGRTQEVLYHLANMADQGTLDPKDVFMDSPMAISATELYDRAKAEHDDELAEMVHDFGSPFAGSLFNRCRTVAESKKLNSRRKPAVIVASSGMATAGRVVHHLLRRLSDPDNSVLFTGYQAHGTRGRQLIEGADTVNIHGHRVRVRARVKSIHGLSAHGDRRDLVRWCQALSQIPKRIFLNHGEDGPRKSLQATLQEKGWPRAVLPRKGHQVPW